MIGNWIFGQQEFLVACLLLGGVFNWDSRINTQKCLGHPPPVVYTKESPALLDSEHIQFKADLHPGETSSA